MMDNWEIFPFIGKSEEREMILSGLLTVGFRIPSLGTFAQYIILFEQLANILKQLLPSGWEGRNKSRSVRQAFFRIFTAGPSCTLSRDSMDTQSRKSVFLTSYYELYLYMLRYLPRLNGEPLKKSKRDLKLERPTISKRLWRQLGDLAYNLGFRSKDIQRLRQANSHEIAEAAVTDVYLDETYDAENIEEDHSQPVFTTDYVELPLKMRMGPYNSNHERDRGHLFLPTIYQDTTPPERKYVTSLMVHRDFIFSFFGRPNGESAVMLRDTHWGTAVCDYRDPSEHSADVHSERPRETSSVYSTDIPVPMALPASSYLDDGVMSEYSVFDLYGSNENELAPGFETTALSMETFHHMDATEEDEIQRAVNTFQAIDKKPIVLLDLDSKSYAKFSASTEGQQALKRVVTERLKNTRCFFTLPDGRQCIT